MKSWKGLLANLALVIGSSVFFLACVEGYLRTTTQLHEFYLPLDFDRDSTRNYYRYQFLERYRDVDQLDIANYDEYLGWDYEIDSQRIRGEKKYSREKPKDTVRILMIGDSYTYGNEVGDSENFPYYTEKLLANAEVLNMGAGGYGVDQMLWKLEKHGLEYQPDILVAGIFTSNFHRAGIDFLAFAKPVLKFNASTGNFETQNRPVPPPASVLKSLKEETRWTSWLWTMISNRLRTLDLDLRKQLVDSYYPDLERLTRHLITQLKKRAESIHAPLVVVHIPGGPRFADPPRGRGMGKLSKYLEEAGVPHIDLETAFLDRFSKMEIHDRLYIHEPDGSLGHFTPEGNLVTAEALSRFLCDQRPRWQGDAALLACPPKPHADF